MSDMWEHAAKSFREAMLDWTRRHRPDYQILARTAWDEEWATGLHDTAYGAFVDGPLVANYLRDLSREMAFRWSKP